MIFVCSYAITNGDPEKFITPFDSDGNKCGDSTNEQFKDYPYKHFWGVVKQIEGTDVRILFHAVCVKECPQKMTDYDCKTNDDVSECSQTPVSTKPQFGNCLPDIEEAKDVLD